MFRALSRTLVLLGRYADAGICSRLAIKVYFHQVERDTMIKFHRELKALKDPVKDLKLVREYNRLCTD